MRVVAAAAPAATRFGSLLGDILSFYFLTLEPAKQRSLLAQTIFFHI
jgi:hypothetical protein